MSDVNYHWLYQYEGRGVIDFVAVCVTHTRDDVFPTSSVTFQDLKENFMVM